MKKLVIFDLDGTILNTLTDITNSINYMLDHFELPNKTEKEIQYYLGRGPKYLILKAVGKELTDNEYEKFYKIYDTHYDANKDVYTKPYDGFDEVFKQLKDSGYLLAVCSNKQHSATVPLIESIFPDTFDFIMGTTPKHKAKPAKDMIIHILEELKVSKENTLYIGDTEIDMNAAINADVVKIAVLYGFRTKEELSVYNPHDYAATPIEIVNIVENYFNK